MPMKAPKGWTPPRIRLPKPTPEKLAEWSEPCRCERPAVSNGFCLGCGRNTAEHLEAKLGLIPGEGLEEEG